MYLFRTKACFYREDLLAPCPKPNVDDNSLSALCDFFFNIFAATLHIRDFSSIRILRPQIVMLTGPTSYGLSHILGLKLESFTDSAEIFYVLFLEKWLVS